MKVNEFAVMRDCVEEGIRYGYMRAYKYCVDHPTEGELTNCVEDAVMAQICEYFEFEFPKYDDDE